MEHLNEQFYDIGSLKNRPELVYWLWRSCWELTERILFEDSEIARQLEKITNSLKGSLPDIVSVVIRDVSQED